MVEVYEIDHLVEFVDTIPLSKRWIFKDFIGFLMVYIPSYTTHMAISGALQLRKSESFRAAASNGLTPRKWLEHGGSNAWGWSPALVFGP